MTRFGQTARAALIGSGIQKSLTPAMHMAEGAKWGIDYQYDLIDLDFKGHSTAALPDLIAKAQDEGLLGLNITYPCKQIALQYVDELSADAEALGAINTIVFRDGKRIGQNTDWSGFAEGFRRYLPDVEKNRAVLLGAGGAGVAVGHALAMLGFKAIDIFDRDQSRANKLASQLATRHANLTMAATTDLAAAMRTADGLVHATPTGMASYPGLPLEPDLIDARHWVTDIVYFPLETELLRTSKAKGCRTLNGGGMAVFQAVHAFEHFTGIKPDAERMSAHFDALVAGNAAKPALAATGE